MKVGFKIVKQAKSAFQMSASIKPPKRTTIQQNGAKQEIKNMQKLEQLAENLEVISKTTGYFKLP